MASSVRLVEGTITRTRSPATASVIARAGVAMVSGPCATRRVIVSPRRTTFSIISDYNMPGMDGLDLLAAVRGDTVINKTVFIMLTGSADREIVQKAAALGVNDYLVKPFAPAALKEKIERVFGALT